MMNTKKKVLVLDDDESIRSIVCKILTYMKMETYSTDDGQKALEEHEKSPFDVVLVDLNMPKMTGEEFIEKISAMSVKQPKKVIFTANPLRITCMPRMVELGVVGTLTKPFNVSQMMIVMNEGVLDDKEETT